jgi:hypothetical protein
MGNAVHSAIRESIHSVSYLCINRLMNFVNQNKIKVITGGGSVDGSGFQAQAPCFLRC